MTIDGALCDFLPSRVLNTFPTSSRRLRSTPTCCWGTAGWHRALFNSTLSLCRMASFGGTSPRIRGSGKANWVVIRVVEAVRRMGARLGGPFSATAAADPAPVEWQFPSRKGYVPCWLGLAVGRLVGQRTAESAKFPLRLGYCATFKSS